MVLCIYGFLDQKDELKFWVHEEKFIIIFLTT